MKPVRLLILSNIIAPYRVALFNAVQRDPRVTLRVLYVAATEGNRSWQVDRSSLDYSYRVLPGWHWPVSRDKTLHLSWHVTSALREFRPDVILLGTDLLGSTASWSAWWFARHHGIPVVRYESRHAYSGDTRWIKDLIFRYLIRRMDRYFVYSPMTRSLLIERYRIPQDRIDVGYNVGDSERFISQVRALQFMPAVQAPQVEGAIARILFIGALDTRKNILGLLEAWRDLEAGGMNDAELVILGDGPLHSEVEARALESQHSSISFLGFLQGESLARQYALADVFVLPSMADPASIALTEALHSGLYVVASERDGSNGLVQEYVNGVVIDPADHRALKAALRTAISYVCRMPAERRKSAIAKSVSEYTLPRYAQRLVASVLAAAAAGTVTQVADRVTTGSSDL